MYLCIYLRSMCFGLHVCRRKRQQVNGYLQTDPSTSLKNPYQKKSGNLGKLQVRLIFITNTVGALISLVFQIVFILRTSCPLKSEVHASESILTRRFIQASHEYCLEQTHSLNGFITPGRHA